MIRVPGTIVELNEHGNFAWGCPRCCVWNKPDSGRCWACGSAPKPEQWILDWDSPREREMLAARMADMPPHRSSSSASYSPAFFSRSARFSSRKPSQFASKSAFRLSRSE
jgi:hypothetical protein